MGFLVKILFLTAAGEMLGLAERVAAKHEVKVFVAGGIIYQLAGMGRVPRVTSWRPEMKWADLIIADYPLSSAEQTAIRDRGRLLFGVGNAGLEELISADPKSGLPFSLTAFWNGHSWVAPSFWATGQKNQLAGDLGPEINNYMSTNVWPVEKTPREVIVILEKADKILAHTDYHGPVTFELSLHNETIQVENIIAHPLMMILAPILGLIKADPVDFLTKIASGGDSSFDYWKQVGVATRLYGSPWPYRMADGMTSPDAIYIDDKTKSSVWMIDIVKQVLSEDNKEYFNFYFGASGSLGIATAIGRKGSRPKDYFREAHRRLEKVITGVHPPLLQHRNDIELPIRTAHKQLRLRGIE